ncbi:TetR/AcrR family transcriptional regulator [Micromonospora parathelypteridis]|uniref:AcrR family transcriptional regulator n=1 Tax=Micromonospora parathelypteridis TaxID=1839617 RepID=A0A840VY35_9ACTN|nr:TetR/AcrR family transcriptional regulator [Micromonospora parathelypteridis]MBB5481557.1 AcrR family transcriptional regulator [Micromonospora parathelypteridis]GGO29301.1 TetR family transcriptional regulator [Micromonospora parathelypteridis]
MLLTMAESSLRERKRERTRQAIVDAAVDLFERHGYEGTKIADIAEAAEIGTRTFFSYFASKEELLFPESDARVAAAVSAIAGRKPGDSPADLLVRALRDVNDHSTEMASPTALLRMRLMQTVPAVRGRGLQIQLDAQLEIARHLQAAFPDELDAVQASALVGAFLGAVTGALQVLLEEPGALDDPRKLQRRMRDAVAAALRPWLSAVR